MKRTVFAFTASVVLAGTFVAAQSQNPESPRDPSQQPQTSPSASQPSSQDRSGSETRLTGCLMQGSSPNVFILDNARTSTDAKTAEGKKYVVVMADASDLREQINRQVTITGMTTEKSGMSTSPSSTPSSTRPGQSGQAGEPGQAGQPGQAGEANRPSDAGQAGQTAQAGQQGPGQSSQQQARTTTAAEERDLPRLTAKSVVRLADVCTTAE